MQSIISHIKLASIIPFAIIATILSVAGAIAPARSLILVIKNQTNIDLSNMSEHQQTILSIYAHLLIVIVLIAIVD